MITNQLAVGLCEGDVTCPAGVSSAGRGGVCSFDRIRVEAEEAIKHAMLVLG